MFAELTEAQRHRVERALDTVPFAKLLGIQIESVVAGHAILSMPIRDDHKAEPRGRSWRGDRVVDRLIDGVCNHPAAY